MNNKKDFFEEDDQDYEITIQPPGQNMQKRTRPKFTLLDDID